MAMTACYPNYDISQSMSQHHHHASSMQQSLRSANLLAAQQQQQQQSQQSPQTQQQQQQQQPSQKDYSVPLHVDCSVEYELPNQAKPPVGGRIEPLLMIHPCYFRKMESQRHSPFINNMPNSSLRSASQSSMATSTALTSSSRRSNVITAAPTVAPKTQQIIQQNHIQQPQQQQQQHMTNMQHQNIQHQIDEYVQRQMAHISQQAQFPLQQQQQPSSSQYSMPAQHQQNWDHYLNANVPNTASMLGKVNIPNQNAYKKSGKRHLSATCANNATYSTAGHLEGALPNGIPRWDEKTVMATIPREYQQSAADQAKVAQTTTCSNVYRNGGGQQPQQQQHTALMSANKRDRDPMLSGGCIYSNSNSDSNLVSSTGLWPLQKSPMAAIPNNNYHQAGPDSIPNNSSNNSNSNSKMISNNNGMTHVRVQPPTSGNTIIHHSHYAQQQQQQQQQQHIHQNDKLINSTNNNNNNTNTNNNIITVKCRQYRNSHRMHPYMMSNLTAPSSVNNALSGVSYFPQLNGPFSQIQQVSCYNV